MSGNLGKAKRANNIVPVSTQSFDEKYDALPQPLRSVLLRIIAWANEREDCALVLHGSLVKGGADEFSDLDLTLIGTKEESVREIAEKFGEFVFSLGEILTSFNADHIATDATRIIYLSVGNWVVKLDVTIAVASAELLLPPEAESVVDRNGILGRVNRREPQPIRETLLFEKLCGWLWFSYTRIERGELFAAARSLDFSREAALLPLIQARLGLPQDGHRRLEQRLPEPLLALLLGTYPAELNRQALLSALARLHKVTLLELELSTVASKAELLDAMSKMWSHVATASGYQESVLVEH
jgi:predicted nucleotidyltransferase